MSNSVTDCIVGEHLVGEARKIIGYSNPKPIKPENKESYKIDSPGGKKAVCYVNKAVRESKLSPQCQTKFKRFIKDQYEGKVSIFEEKKDFIGGNQLLCECEKGTPDIHSKKRSHASASHSAMRYDFKGSFSISIVNLPFTKGKAYRVKR